jgi:hypothetical protein
MQISSPRDHGINRKKPMIQMKKSNFSRMLPMKAVVFYDDFAFVAKASETLQRIGQQSNAAVECSIENYSTVTLQRPDTQ